MEVVASQSCLTVCYPKNCSPPGSSVHGIFQARILEWVGVSSSRESSQPSDWTRALLHCRQILYHLSHQGNPYASTFVGSLLCLYPTNVGNMISGSSAFSSFSKPSLYTWKSLVHILLIPSLKDLGHYLARMWNKYNFAVVWAFFGIV